MHIYHIVLPEKWAFAADKDFYEAENFATEGFIHCSFAEQLDSVLERYYAGVAKVIILEIDPTKLTSELIEELSTSNEIYPHIYGRINRDAVVGIEERNLIGE
jgi:Uncharacterized protein conserved in bacteria